MGDEHVCLEWIYAKSIFYNGDDIRYTEFILSEVAYNCKKYNGYRVRSDLR